MVGGGATTETASVGPPYPAPPGLWTRVGVAQFKSKMKDGRQADRARAYPIISVYFDNVTTWAISLRLPNRGCWRAMAGTAAWGQRRWPSCLEHRDLPPQPMILDFHRTCAKRY